MDTDRAWQKWGKEDPYFGVLSLPLFRTDNIENSRGEFMHTGEMHVAALMQQIESSFGSPTLGRAVDFGCGVGRLVIPFARRFDSVIGVDISDAMLAEAGRNSAAEGITNILFVKSDDTLSAVPQNVDLVHSSLVLQHIPMARGKIIIESLLSKLGPGGVASLQFPLARRFPPIKALAYFFRHHVPGGQQAINLLQGRKLSCPPMQMNEYPLVWVLETYLQAGIWSPQVSLHANGDTLSAIVTGRKHMAPP